MSSSSATPADLADALRWQAVQASATTPSVRGADWRLATVATVGTDGTVTTGDGITARRMDSYLTPAVGDQVVLTVSGSGNWLALGRTAPATTAGTWQTLSLNTGWSPFSATYYTPAYRINGDGTASLSGLARAPASTTGVATVGTLPAAAAPAKRARHVTEVASGVFGVLDINSDGTVQITDYTGTASWAALDVATRYRLT
ncbi:hypothetical protein ACFQ2B_27995 [Streptomyces stramineus]|uniref:Calcium-binding protein n=1 Tax=Streptomyces stramineus TaxID=173861 RepID=A0ABP3JLW4_9ACTN